MGLLWLFGPVDLAWVQPRQRSDPEVEWLAGFRDGISHWQKQNDIKDYPRFAPGQVQEIADNLLLYQRANGGWKPNEDMTRILPPAEKHAIERDKGKKDTSFDNRNTYTQIEYLAHAFERTGEARFKEGCLRGLEFTLSAQYSNGGWPHSFPRKTNYYPHITIQDDVMVGILQLMWKAARGDRPFGFVDNNLRDRCRRAAERGDALLLKLQVRVDGRPTIWSGQYDENTLVACPGRTFEPTSLSASESVGVVRYLMSKAVPSAEQRAAIEAAVDWYRRSQLTGFRIVRVAAPTVKFEHHTARDDVVQEFDDKAPPIWARFYEIDSNRAFMANRDGKKVYRLADVSRERRTGANWFGYYARDLLAREYPAWRKKHSVQ